MEQQTQAYTTRTEFAQLLRQCLSRAEHSVLMFDPDFSIWELGGSEVDVLLHGFLRGGGRLKLVAHDNSHLERHAPRFLRLLKDYAHAIECRRTGKPLRRLTDSFCIVDQRTMLRRFHAAHLRGEAIFDAPTEVQPFVERFEAIWIESEAGLYANSTGL